MTEMMKAAIFVEPGKMAVEEVPKAMLEQDDDIVIRVVRTCAVSYTHLTLPTICSV